MPHANLAHIDSWTAKAYFAFVHDTFLNPPSYELHRLSNTTVNELFKKQEELIKLFVEPRKSAYSIRPIRLAKATIRYSLTIAIVAIVSPTGCFFNGAMLIIHIVKMPTSQIFYWIRGESDLRHMVFKENFTKIKRYGDAFFREAFLASTFYLSLLPMFMGYYLGALYVFSLPAYIAFSDDKRLKILLPAKVRAAFMKTIILRDQFAVTDEKGKMLPISPQEDDENVLEEGMSGTLSKLYQDLAQTIRNLLEAANLEVYWEGDVTESKEQFLKSVREKTTNEIYKDVEDATKLLWRVREILLACIKSTTLSIFHDARRENENHVEIPDSLKDPATQKKEDSASQGQKDKWEDVLKSALDLKKEEGEGKVIARDNGVPNFDDESKREKYKEFREKILKKVSPSVLFGNPANKTAVIQFYRKAVLIIYRDKLPQNTSEALLKEVDELFKLLSSAYSILNPA